MKHLPLFFDLSGRKVVVVGEGAAADRRADLVRSSGAEIRRVASSAVEASDFRGAAAAFIATGDADRDAAAQRLAKSAGVPVNVADRPSLCDFILPAIVDRDEVVVAISTGGASPTLATVLRGRIEAALPQRIGAVARLAATFRAQVNALIGEPNRRRAFWRRLVEGPVGRLALAGDDAGARRSALGELDAARRRMAPVGIAHIVGAGPGDPDLLTLRAAQLLQEADAILHDDLVPSAILARARRDSELLAVGKPAVTFVSGHSAPENQGTSRDAAWPSLAAQGHTLAIYMAATEAASVRDRLLGAGVGPSTPVAIVENGTRPDERVSVGRLADLARLAVPHVSRGDAGPSLIIVGDVAALATTAEPPRLAKVS